MLLPLSDAPNPRGVPIVTYLLIALNVAVYALVTLPLGFTPVDPRDPLLRDYLMMVRDVLPAGHLLREAIGSISAYDLFVFAHGYKPAAPALTDLFASLFLHGGIHAPRREHAVPVDLRRQRRAPPGQAPVPVLVPRHRRRGHADVLCVRGRLDGADGRRLGCDLRASSGSTSSGSRATPCGCSSSCSRSSWTSSRCPRASCSGSTSSWTTSCRCCWRRPAEAGWRTARTSAGSSRDSVRPG